jgi:hypothetical protein
MDTNIRLLAALATTLLVLPLCAQGTSKSSLSQKTPSISFNTPPYCEGLY